MRIKDLLKIKPDTDSPTGYVVYVKAPGSERRNLPAPACYHIDQAHELVRKLFTERKVRRGA